MTPGSEGDSRAWLRLSEGLVAGIHHALNNRMAALGGAVQVLQGDIELEHPLVGLLSNEIRRLESTTGLLRLLGPGDGGFEPVQLTDIMVQAERLFEVHHALRDLKLEIDFPGDLLPVWSVPVGLLRTVMMLLAAAGAGIPRPSPWGGVGEGPVLSLKVVGDLATVRMVVDVPDRPDDAELPAVTSDDVAAMAKRVGGTLRTYDGDGTSRWELELPTLPEARRRERELASGD